MGHSMGGKAVMYLAESMTERVESLIVIDIAPISYKSAEHLNQSQTHTQILDGMLSVKFKNVHNREDIDTQLARSIYSPKVRSFLLKNVERTSTGEYRWRINVHTIRDQLPGILDGLDPASFKSGQGITGFPVLFIRGENSDYITSEMIPAIQRIFPMAEVNTIPGAGHWLHMEQPSLLIKTVKYFLLED